jgi:heterotetrameric sarcosine oxidase gamma subunit
VPEMPQRRSALLDAYQTGTFGATPEDGPGIQLVERRGLAIIHLAGPGGDEDFRAATKDCLGCEVPVIPNTTATIDGRCLLWLAPTRWLLVSAQDAPGDLERDLSAALASHSGAVTDVSSGRTVFRVAGRDARHLLAKGCPLDFHASRFKPGDCAQSILGAINVLLHATGDGSVIDLYCARGFALSMWEWLTDAAGEFGYRIDGRTQE